MFKNCFFIEHLRPLLNKERVHLLLTMVRPDGYSSVANKYPPVHLPPPTAYLDPPR